jgi:DNA-binding PadR family transcriptional regulator
MSETRDKSRVSMGDHPATAIAGTGQLVAAPDIFGFTIREFLILGVLKEREQCGSEVVRSFSILADYGNQPGTGIIYPLLKNLVKDGVLCARRTSGTPRVYYSLTGQGEARLRAVAARLATVNTILQSLAGDHATDRPQ